MCNSKVLVFCFIFFPVFSKGFVYFSLNTINKLINGKNNEVSHNYSVKKNDPEPEDAYLNITQLVTKYGYEIEEHTVTTEDGYILNIHRMPSRNLTKVILLMHGILDSSDSWVLQGPNNALAYSLVEEGFDVWMGNARGNKYSSSHTILNDTQTQFWKFSWEEIGIYDLPAMIDYILNITKTNNLHYVGYSQGTTVFYVMNSLKPEYNGKIKTMFSLAPVAWMSNAKSPIIKIITSTYGVLGYLLNIDLYGSSTEYLNKIQKFFCNILWMYCDSLLQSIVGSDYRLIKPSFMPIISGHVPTTSSSLQIMHYIQLYSSARFCRFDFGENENLLRYGQESPPDYDLANVTVPVVFFFSSNDWLSDIVDVSLLYNALPNVYNTYYVENFNHFDYMYADIAKDLVYSNIIKEIKEFEVYNN
ncbi:unnamed protein product [Euphydryas editha]|uniref:Lipase n=1 Tax=Euphydryas editha TaxID=104508 RepID=A0AAU9TC96_EUPED|nr:unnamed protein product [Euphydryas editha]